ncbi:MAG: hypothetical protein ACP5OG_00665 [Candidatus Nanoarchaeia archaeon]
MPKVEFKFNVERDLWNHWHKSNNKGKFHNFIVSKSILDICQDRTYDSCKEELKNYLSNLYESGLFNPFIECVEKSWRPIESEFFKRMNKLMKNNYEKDIIAYLTTSDICPYNSHEPSFMFSFFYPLPKALATCGHEIMHLYFHDFFWDKIEKQIGNTKTGDLKESLTVLLNHEFKNLWFYTESGYEMHKDLRHFIENQWVNMNLENKDIELLLNNSVEWIKNRKI